MKQGLKQLPKQTLAITPLLQNQIRLMSLSGNEVRKSLNQIVYAYLAKLLQAVQYAENEHCHP